MKRIDRETVQRILDTADIVDVVSDFVTLKRRGANYIGLCPFHSERTPSFSVSKAKGICKCFSCGKGGSPVNFLMELEQMSFNEALRYIARKYNIEIKESEVSDAEREAASKRESLLAVNDEAMKIMAANLTDTDEGKAIGLSYFNERGISSASVERFNLGYALDKSTALWDALKQRGYNEEAIIETGLCIKQEGTGRVYDRFHGRVIYPVKTISGRVVAFGGRILRSDKKAAKYVNSPESAIYSKSRELYGLYQAKSSISRSDKCILVEGYMDVISMSQRGVENVVASSGTSLTEGQIRLIHRFTDNITVIYDSDAAGIKASLRGIDMLLAEGMKVKVVLLPDGDDPDSFAQAHTTTEIEDYIKEHEVDFIRFKTGILLEGAEDDPIKRAEVIADICSTIAVIPDEIARTVYIQECSRRLGIDETTLNTRVARNRMNRAEKDSLDRARQQARDSITNGSGISVNSAAEFPVNNDVITPIPKRDTQEVADDKLLEPAEREIARYIVKYGMLNLDYLNPEGNIESIPVIDYLQGEMQYYGLTFTGEVFKAVVQACGSVREQEWESAFAKFDAQSLEERARTWQEGIDDIQASAETLETIKNREGALKTRINDEYREREREFKLQFFSHSLVSSPDDAVRNCVTDLIVERHRLSKVHSKYSPVETECDRLDERLPQAIYALRDAHVQVHLRQLRRQLAAQQSDDIESIQRIMSEIKEYDTMRRQLAKQLGERVISPR